MKAWSTPRGANALDVVLHGLRLLPRSAELRGELGVDLGTHRDDFLEFLDLHLHDIEERVRDDDVLHAGGHRFPDHQLDLGGRVVARREDQVTVAVTRLGLGDDADGFLDFRQQRGAGRRTAWDS